MTINGAFADLIIVDDPEYNIHKPQDLIICVSSEKQSALNHSWDECEIEEYYAGEGSGAVSYEIDHGDIDYTVITMVECPGPGIFRIIGITARETEDDMKFYYQRIEEIQNEN